MKIKLLLLVTTFSYAFSAHAFFLCESKLKKGYELNDEEAKALCDSKFSNSINGSLKADPTDKLKKTLQILLASGPDHKIISYEEAKEEGEKLNFPQIRFLRKFTKEVGFDKANDVVTKISPEQAKKASDFLENPKYKNHSISKVFAETDKSTLVKVFQATPEQIDVLPELFQVANSPKNIVKVIELSKDKLDKTLVVQKNYANYPKRLEKDSAQTLEELLSLNPEQFEVAMKLSKYQLDFVLPALKDLNSEKLQHLSEIIKSESGFNLDKNTTQELRDLIANTSVEDYKCISELGLSLGNKEVQACKSIKTSMCDAKKIIITAMRSNTTVPKSIKKKIMQDFEKYDHYTKQHALAFVAIFSKIKVEDVKKIDLVKISSRASLIEGSPELLEIELSKPNPNFETLREVIDHSPSLYTTGESFTSTVKSYASSGHGSGDACRTYEGATAFRDAKKGAIQSCESKYSNKKELECETAGAVQISNNDFYCVARAKVSSKYKRDDLKSCDLEDVKSMVTSLQKPLTESDKCIGEDCHVVNNETRKNSSKKKDNKSTTLPEKLRNTVDK